jgi:hypothetical protein
MVSPAIAGMLQLPVRAVHGYRTRTKIILSASRR